MALGRFSKLIFGTGIDGTDNGDSSLTVDVDVTDAMLGSGSATSSSFLRGDRTWQAVSVDPADDTLVWLPLTTTVAGEDVLVFGADHSLIPTLIPL